MNDILISYGLQEGEGGDYHSQKAGHWIIGQISNPMSRYEQYKASRVSWGINVLGRQAQIALFGWFLKLTFPKFLCAAHRL